MLNIGKIGIKSYIYPSELGKIYYKLNHTQQKKLATKLCLRIPIVQNRLIEPNEIDTVNRDLKILSTSTEKIKSYSVLNILKIVKDSYLQE